MNKMTYMGYTAQIEFDTKDKIIVGRVIDIDDIITFHGTSIGEFETAMQTAVDGYLFACEQLGQAAEKPASGCLMLHATGPQEAILRRAAEVAHQSLTDFILDSACLAAEQTLLDQRLFMVPGTQHQALMDLLDRPAQDSPGLQDLFSRKAPWSGK